jgi:hypothetical protein
MEVPILSAAGDVPANYCGAFRKRPSTSGTITKCRLALSWATFPKTVLGDSKRAGQTTRFPMDVQLGTFP